LIGCPPFSGFFSKDAILLAAWYVNKPIFILGLITAFLTAFYMTRLFVVVFLGKSRTEEASHGHEVPFRMKAPLIILAVLSLITGWFGTEGYFVHAFPVRHAEHTAIVPILAVAVFLLGTIGGWFLYSGKVKDPILIPMFRDKFYFDELYAALVAGTQDLLAGISSWFDKWILDGVFVRGLAGVTWGTGFVLRFFQHGICKATPSSSEQASSRLSTSRFSPSERPMLQHRTTHAIL
jgi:NADH-quinone oxidoreductase subunit L